LRLIEDTDVLIENFRPGTLERWGLGWDRLSAVNPRLVMVRISGFGQDGPYAKRPGFGTVAEAMAGLPMRTGFPDGAPLLSSLPLADNIAGLFAAFSAMFALYNRDHGSGVGQVIDIGLHEPIFRILEDQVIGFDQLGRVPQRMGNRMPGAAPRGAFQSKDERWIAIAVSTDKAAQRLLTSISGPALAEDPRFQTNADRVKNVAALDGLIGQWIGERSADEVLAIFERDDVVAISLLDIGQIFEDPQILHRQNIVSVADALLGSVRVPGVVPKFSETPGEVAHLSAALGEHNQEIFGERLGLTADQIKALANNGVI
jgi:crotonobetainyl-CoA:carnitine CoA-transferase CaiB-like acyl-CoA transferase